MSQQTRCVCQGAGLNKRKIIEKAVADEVTSILDSGVDEKKLTDLKKGQPNVIMFVGLQARPPGRCMAAGKLPAVPCCVAASLLVSFVPLEPGLGSCGCSAQLLAVTPLATGARFSPDTCTTPHAAVYAKLLCMPSSVNVCGDGRIVARAGRG